MQVTFDMGVVLMSIVGALLGLIQIIGIIWIRGVQEKLQRMGDRMDDIKSGMSAMRESAARDLVTRVEVQQVRQEFIDELRTLNGRIEKMNGRHDNKQGNR